MGREGTNPFAPTYKRNTTMRISRSKAARLTLDAMTDTEDDPERLALVFTELAAMFKGKKSMNKSKFMDWLNHKLD